jgi:tetratricopeptide (TPR) repeat protein
MFRRPGRSFLMPPVDVPLSGDSIVDLSHESLMRCWTRLISWTEEERASAAVYVRLSRAAGWFDEGAAGLYRDPELELALRWRRQTMPSAAWARRYDDGFDRAMRFLDRSQQAREKERAARRRQWRMWQGAAVLFGLLLIAATWGFLLYRRSSNLAEKNLKDAVAAVNASLAIVDRDPAKLGIDSPQIVKFRADLATKAKDFYAAFAARGYAGESLRRDIAAAHFGLGHANRVLGDRKQAAQEYGLAIKEFGDLVRDYRSNPDYRQDLANAHTFLGETLRQSRETYEQAEKAYGAAKDFQEALRRDYPGEAKYQKDLARTLYNRGILLHSRAELLEDAATGDTASIEMAFERAATDFRQAIQLLDPLAKGDDEVSLQGLARALYDLGNLLYRLPETTQEAERLTLRAVAIHEGLRKRAPENLEYAIELSTFFSNLAVIQDELGNLTGARMNSARAIALLEALARPAPSLSVDLADAHSIRGVLLSQGNVPASLVEFERAQDIFTGLEQDEGALALSAFHLRYADLLVNLAMVERDYPRDVKVRQLFLRGVGAYLAIARRIAASGSWEQAQMVLDGMGRVVKALPDREQDSVILSYKEVETALQARATAKSQ